MNSEKQGSGTKSKENSGNYDDEAILLGHGISSAVLKYEGENNEQGDPFDKKIRFPANMILQDSCVTISICQIPEDMDTSVLTIHNINLYPDENCITVRISSGTDRTQYPLKYRLKILLSNPIGRV